MSANNDQNMRAVVRNSHDRIVTLLNYFHDNPNASFQQVSWGNPQYLEQLKVDLVAMASCIEDDLVEKYAAPMEDHA